MTTYSLYVKTHQVTGLKYLGQTSKSDPHKYTGSGKYWLRHIKQHGKNRFGEKNPNFDPIVYYFEHVSGLTFIGTRFEFNNTCRLTSGSVSRLLNGEYKTTQGWKLANLVANTDR